VEKDAFHHVAVRNKQRTKCKVMSSRLKQSHQQDNAHLKSWKKRFYRGHRNYQRAARESGNERYFGC